MAYRAVMGVASVAVGLLALLAARGQADDYAYKPGDPQPSGWPLTEDERTFVLKPEYERRPGSEAKKHLPEMWPVVPSAGFWTGTAWLDTHAKLVEHVQEKKGAVDLLLVGDSITQQWGSPLDKKPMNAGWVKQFGKAKVVNIGIGGDKSQNVLWRLDHGGVDGLEPRCIVLMIGNNNMFGGGGVGLRDNFPQTVLDSLAKRVGVRCSNPGCRKPTSGPNDDPTKAVNVGVGAHITAASAGGPRYDAMLSGDERRSGGNAIWLCQTCAKLIDSDPARFTVALLREWKRVAEEYARQAMESPSKVGGILAAHHGNGLAAFFSTGARLTVINQTTRDLPRLYARVQPVNCYLTEEGETVERLMPGQDMTFSCTVLKSAYELAPLASSIVSLARDSLSICVYGSRMNGGPLFESYQLGAELHDIVCAIQKELVFPTRHEVELMHSTEGCPRCHSRGRVSIGEDCFNEPYYIFECKDCRFRWNFENSTCDGFECSVTINARGTWELPFHLRFTRR